MHIINIMLAKSGGGIEQAAVDYCEGLRDLGHKVTAIVFPGSWAQTQMQMRGITTLPFFNLSEYDVIAWLRLARMIKSLAPDAVISHANRATGISLRALKKRSYPLIGVVQNYFTRRYNACDAVFTTTYDLMSTLAAQGISEDKIFHVPNMVKVSELPHRHARSNPPVLGAMGRFVKKKGFDVYIEALAILKSRGIPFKAVLGGTGEEESSLKALAEEKGLGQQLEFIGWISDRKNFYTSIDIFCLPSLHEPFGIVLLEAFAHGTPIISTDSEGPKDIITPNYDAVITPKGNAGALAEAMEKLIRDPAFCEKLAANGFVKVKTRYSQEVVCKSTESALEKIIAS